MGPCLKCVHRVSDKFRYSGCTLGWRTLMAWAPWNSRSIHPLMFVSLVSRLHHPVKRFKPSENKVEEPLWPPYRPAHIQEHMEPYKPEPSHEVSTLSLAYNSPQCRSPSYTAVNASAKQYYLRDLTDYALSWKDGEKNIVIMTDIIILIRILVLYRMKASVCLCHSFWPSVSRLQIVEII